MKSLVEHLSEIENQNKVLENAEDGKGGHWEEYYDEDIEEKVKVWVNDPDPKELAKMTEEIKKKAQAAKSDFEAKSKKERELIDKADNAHEQLMYYKNKISKLRLEYKSRYAEMQEEVGTLYANGNDAEVEKITNNEYWPEFNRIHKEIDEYLPKLNKWQKTYNEIKEQINKIW